MSDNYYKSGDALKKEITHTRPPFPMTALWSLGGGSVCIKTGRHLYLFDPEFESSDDGPVLPFEPDASLHIDYVFLGDFHSMLQIQSLRKLAMVSEKTQFIVPEPHVQSITDAGLYPDRIFGARPFQFFSLDGAQVVPVTEDAGSEREGSRLGYAIRVPGMVLYHSSNIGRELAADADIAGLTVDVLCASFEKRDKSIGELARRTSCDLVLPSFPEKSIREAPPEDITCRYHELLPGERYFYQK